jgi:hypothetical protein
MIKEECFGLSTSPITVRVAKPRRLSYDSHLTWQGPTRVAQNSVGEISSKALFGSPRRRWENNIKMDCAMIYLENQSIMELRVAHNRVRWVLEAVVLNPRVLLP